MSIDIKQLEKELAKKFPTQNLKVVIKDYSSDSFYCWHIVMRGKKQSMVH